MTFKERFHLTEVAANTDLTVLEKKVNTNSSAMEQVLDSQSKSGNRNTVVENCLKADTNRKKRCANDFIGYTGLFICSNQKQRKSNIYEVNLFMCLGHIGTTEQTVPGSSAGGLTVTATCAPTISEPGKSNQTGRRRANFLYEYL